MHSPLIFRLIRPRAGSRRTEIAIQVILSEYNKMFDYIHKLWYILSTELSIHSNICLNFKFSYVGHKIFLQPVLNRFFIKYICIYIYTIRKNSQEHSNILKGGKRASSKLRI